MTKEISRRDMSPEERLHHRRRQKRNYTLRQQGRPMRVTPNEFQEAKALIGRAQAGGMADRQIGRQVGVHETTITKIIRGAQGGLNRRTYDKIMQLVFDPPTKTPGRAGTIGAHVDPTGTIRRIQALAALGLTGTHLAPLLGLRKEEINRMAVNAKPRGFVFGGTAAVVAEWYSKLQHVDPGDYGVPGSSVSKAMTRAREHGWAPPGCWDDDTIDNPDAHPEWTGACGTRQGYLIHQRERIPACPACIDAEGRVQAVDELIFRPALLRAAITRKGMPDSHLEAAAGLSKGAVTKWLVHGHCPRPATINKVAEALDGQWTDYYEQDTRT